MVPALLPGPVHLHLGRGSALRVARTVRRDSLPSCAALTLLTFGNPLPGWIQAYRPVPNGISGAGPNGADEFEHMKCFELA